MESDPAGTAPTRPHRLRKTRMDRAVILPLRLSDRTVAWLSFAALAFGFVLLGAHNLDLGPDEARLGLAAGGSVGPLGQVFGYWSPDVWPGEVLPSMALARLGSASRASAAVVRWPAALAAILAGWLLFRGMYRALGHRAATWAGVCWFASLAVIDRSGGAGIPMILGVATLAAVERLLSRGADWVAGLWVSLAFLSGGWPPLVLIGLVIVVIGRPGSYFSLKLVLPPLATAVAWSIATIRAVSFEAWASALGMPLTRGIDGSLPFAVLLLGLPWTPFALLSLSGATREAWPDTGRAWVKGWLQAALACGIAGTAVPGLGPAARIVAMAGLLVAAAAGLDSAWRRGLTAAPRRFFVAALSVILALWLIVMTYGSFVWILSMPYYRTVGIIMAVLVLAAAILGWSALRTANPRRGLVTLVLLAIGLKLAYWGFYAPEWNYRFSQGPWGRAIGQWIPRKWPVYTFLDWPPDLAFYVGRPVRQLHNPRFLNYLPGQESRFVLLREAEFDHWPDYAPPLTLVTRLRDQYGEPRILARTRGLFPVPGQSDASPSTGENAAPPFAQAE
jgi:hypothetical protein